ncbi:hypothetical protein [Permianibacter aggregans]|uniref:Uncharacterized protein n=1 Tax=Permianibacter aggregans TaxID=1510150 RepID=A0A4R6UVS1_9GAMM|nr:hypothetical protein [Permianibacter aggregans]QGX39319.1 hypothetical protein E2H98_06465 [Permianibacter aggregans]TDQ49943.1 hypothetical protein EV696_103318 [Permianibacter aggregans]
MIRAALMAISLAAASPTFAQEQAPLTLTLSDTQWHVSINGFRWQLPAACLNPRKLGEDDAGRKLGEDVAGRRLGEDDAGRKLGEADAGRKLGEDVAGRRLGEDDAGRKLGEADAGRKLGEEDAGRKLGEGDAGRKLGEDVSGRKLGEDTSGRKLGDDVAGRRLGEEGNAPRCEYVSNNEIVSAVYIWPVVAGSVELNRQTPELQAVQTWRDGALLLLR